MFLLPTSQKCFQSSAQVMALKITTIQSIWGQVFFKSQQRSRTFKDYFPNKWIFYFVQTEFPQEVLSVVPGFYFRALRCIVVNFYTLVESSNGKFINMTTAFIHLFRKYMLNGNHVLRIPNKFQQLLPGNSQAPGGEMNIRVFIKGQETVFVEVGTGQQKIKIGSRKVRLGRGSGDVLGEVIFKVCFEVRSWNYSREEIGTKY